MEQQVPPLPRETGSPPIRVHKFSPASARILGGAIKEGYLSPRFPFDSFEELGRENERFDSYYSLRRCCARTTRRRNKEKRRSVPSASFIKLETTRIPLDYTITNVSTKATFSSSVSLFCSWIRPAVDPDNMYTPPDIDHFLVSQILKIIYNMMF